MRKGRLPMRKILEILRLRWEQSRTVRETSQALGVSTGAVTRTTERARKAGLSYEGAVQLGELELEKQLYPGRPAVEGPFEEPSMLWVDEELRRVGVTLELLHEEYVKEHGRKAMAYTTFCRRYQRWRKHRNPVMRQVHLGGDKLFVDFSGKKPRVVDPQSGEAREVELFVAVLGASNYTYAEAVATQQIPDWIGAHTRALSFLGGVPRTLVPDQLRSGVSDPDGYEPGVQRTYEDLGRHYGTTVLPARPRKPRDKAKVEAGVLVAQRWILARLRHETFFSLESLNARIRELVEDLNQRPMRSFGGLSRRALFERLDQKELAPLPAHAFEPAEWEKAKVHEDYHVAIRRHWYSVPYALIGQEVEVRLTAKTVEAYWKGSRVATHVRCDDKPYEPSTNPAHRPAKHQAVFEQAAEHLLTWAHDVGPHALILMQRFLDPAHNVHGMIRIRSGFGLRSLHKTYDLPRIEEACRRVLSFERVSYKSVERTLRLGLDLTPWEEDTTASAPPIEHDQVRGAAYFESLCTYETDPAKEEDDAA